MKNKLPKFILASLLLTVFAVVFHFSAPFSLAQTPNPESLTTNSLTTNPESLTTNPKEVGFTAIPPRLGENNGISLQPGEKTQVSINVRNNSQQTIELESFVLDMIVDEDGSTPMPVTDEVSNRWGLASWLTITPSRHVLKPREINRINILIEIPEDALPGGHYAMVLHQPVTKEVQAGQEMTASGISQRTGTLIYVIVEGPINEEAFIRDFAFPKFTEYGPVPFDFKIENMSDIHISPQMGVEIYNIFGKKLETIPVGSKNIFPLTNRDFDGTWDRIWGYGFYKAKLIMSFGSQGQVVIANSSFWFLPIKIVLAAATLLLSFLVIGVATRRHLIHRRQEEEKKMAALQEKVEELEAGN